MRFKDKLSFMAFQITLRFKSYHQIMKSKLFFSSASSSLHFLQMNWIGQPPATRKAQKFSVGGCGARAVSRKTPIYFILYIILYIYILYYCEPANRQFYQPAVLLTRYNAQCNEPGLGQNDLKYSNAAGIVLGREQAVSKVKVLAVVFIRSAIFFSCELIWIAGL